jgi:hypothetical protein
MENTTQPQIIASRVFDPRQPGLFCKPKKSEPAEHATIACRCEDCPLRKAGHCVLMHVLGGRCPYGTYRKEAGPTARSGKLSSWLQERRGRHPGVGWKLSSPPEKMAFVGDYVYLPYGHMTMCKEVPFLAHSAFIVSGVEFIKREDWTLENVLKLIDFRPQAMFGGEITDYQKKYVPKFVAHLREVDPAMWRQAVAVRPAFDVAPNYVGRTARLSTLAHPITLQPKSDEYPVAWEWDGKVLRSTSRHAYGETWGGIRPKSVAVEVVPEESAAVVVADNAWVTPETVFVD